MTLLAAVAAFTAVWLWSRPMAARRLQDGPSASSRPRRLIALLRRALPVLLAAAIALVGWWLWGASGAAVGTALALPGVTSWLIWTRHRHRADALAKAAQVAEACQQLAGLVRIGHVPGTALRLAARDSPVLGVAAASQAVGGAVPEALRHLATGPGLAGLAQLATAWQVAERTGASLTATLDALAERLATERKVRAVVAAELSAPRATGRLLAGLPFAGVSLGYAVGGDPVAFLTGSWPGQACLVAGSLLGCAGVLWTESIAGTEEG